MPSTISKIPAGELQVGDTYAPTKKALEAGKGHRVEKLDFRPGGKSGFVYLEGGGRIRPRATTDVWVQRETTDEAKLLPGERPSEAAMRLSEAEAEEREKVREALVARGVDKRFVLATLHDAQAQRAREAAAGGHPGIGGKALEVFILTGETGGGQAREAQAKRTAAKPDAGGGPRGPKAGSMTSAMVEVLKGKRNPMNAKEITKAIMDRKLAPNLQGKTPDATVGAKLSTEAKKDDGLFERVAPGQYKLRAAK